MVAIAFAVLVRAIVVVRVAQTARQPVSPYVTKRQSFAPGKILHGLLLPFGAGGQHDARPLLLKFFSL